MTSGGNEVGDLLPFQFSLHATNNSTTEEEEEEEVKTALLHVVGLRTQ